MSEPAAVDGVEVEPVGIVSVSREGVLLLVAVASVGEASVAAAAVAAARRVARLGPGTGRSALAFAAAAILPRLVVGPVFGGSGCRGWRTLGVCSAASLLGEDGLLDDEVYGDDLGLDGVVLVLYEGGDAEVVLPPRRLPLLLPALLLLPRWDWPPEAADLELEGPACTQTEWLREFKYIRPGTAAALHTDWPGAPLALLVFRDNNIALGHSTRPHKPAVNILKTMCLKDNRIFCPGARCDSDDNLQQPGR